MTAFVLSLLLVLSACLAPQHPSDIQIDLVLRGGLLIDGTGSVPLDDAAVVVQGGRIVWVGESNLVSVPVGASVVELDGAAILPGFINAHVHFGFSASNLHEWAWQGVTTVRDMGATYNSRLFSERDELNADHTNARLVSAGPMVTVPGGYPTVPWNSPSAYPVSTTEAAGREVGQLIENGADFIKIALERGDLFGTDIPVLSGEMTNEIVRVAHEMGTLVSAHITAARDLELVLAGGVDDAAHMAANTVSDDAIRRMVEAGIYWVPTLELWHNVGGSSQTEAHRNLERFVAAGGMVALGTDFGGYDAPFDLGMPVRELQWMRESGMTPMQVIVAATKNSAYLCNLGAELGTIEVGKTADILVVNGNPMEDLVGSVTDVRLVIHNGVVIRGGI